MREGHVCRVGCIAAHPYTRIPAPRTEYNPYVTAFLTGPDRKTSIIILLVKHPFISFYARQHAEPVDLFGLSCSVSRYSLEAAEGKTPALMYSVVDGLVDSCCASTNVHPCVAGHPVCRDRPISSLKSQTSAQNLQVDWPVPAYKVSCYAGMDVTFGKLVDLLAVKLCTGGRQIISLVGAEDKVVHKLCGISDIAPLWRVAYTGAIVC